MHEQSYNGMVALACELSGGAAMAMAALGFAAAGARAREIERERVTGASEGRDTRWPLQRTPDRNVAHPQRMYATRRRAAPAGFMPAIHD